MIKRFLIFGILIVGAVVFSACANNREKVSGIETTRVSERDAALSVIFNRKSVRNYIKDKAISDEDIEILVKAGMAAPSGKDNRPWEFVVINDRTVLESMSNELQNAKMLADAPLAIVVCGDSIRSFYWYLDCSAATQNILLAAEAIGLGAVWTAAYPYDDRMEVVNRHLELPSNILPLVVIPIGYPAGEDLPKNKYDESRIHFNKW